jgi:hypothetical protein
VNDQATNPDSVAGHDRDPVQEVRDHLEHALAALEFLRATLPPAGAAVPSGRTSDSQAGGE